MSKSLIVLTVIAVLTSPRCGAQDVREEDEPDLPPYDCIQRRYTKDIELRRYFGGVFVEIQSPPDNFFFTCDYSNRKRAGFLFTSCRVPQSLRAYFEGRNFARKKVNYSGPLLITLNTWGGLKPTTGAFYVTDESEKQRFPTPFYPNFFQLHEPAYYYVKRIRHTMDIRKIMHEAFEMMADVLVRGEAFSRDEIKVAMFNYPVVPGGLVQKDEIWVKKEIRPIVDRFHQQNSAEELRKLGNLWLTKEPQPDLDTAYSEEYLLQRGWK